MAPKASEEQIMTAQVEMSKAPCFFFFYVQLEAVLTCNFVRPAFNIITYLTFYQRSLNVSAFIQGSVCVRNCFSIE